MDKWIYESLSELLDFPVPDDLTQYILQIQDERDLNDYLKTLLDFDNHKHRNFIRELKKRRMSENVLVGYKKKADDHLISDNNSKQVDNKKKSKSSKDDEKIDKKKKSKFVNIFSDDGKDKLSPLLLKNRIKCDCEAKNHSLINNCLHCGRIVCAQEGSGPCFFCGELVCTPDQQSLLSMNNRQSDNLYNKLMDQKVMQNADQFALSQRDKLLEFDRNSAKRTQVIDDECDYYQQSDSVWLSEKQRQEMQKREAEMRDKKHASRSKKAIEVDFYGRQIINDDYEDSANNSDYTSGHCQELNAINNYDDDLSNHLSSLEFVRPQYIATNNIIIKTSKSSTNKNFLINNRRIQDKQLFEMRDDGYCLSMHQPYASLLVAGIKTHEGRTWYSAHRGRLWIHAGAKVPSPEEISSIINHYQITNDKAIFPKYYSTGCILGYVTVVDVLPQEEYQKIYAGNLESDSPYVFICEDFHELPFKFPMQGKHKIYKLDKPIHQAALKCLMRKN